MRKTEREHEVGREKEEVILDYWTARPDDQAWWTCLLP